MLGDWLRKQLKPLGLTVGRRWPFVTRLPPPQKLSPELSALQEWRAADGDPVDCELYRIWKEIPGGHKWRHYFDVYAQLLDPLRNRPLRLLEIGIYRGGSLKMWRKYLHPESVIVGLDLDPACRQYDNPAEHVHCRIGDQTDEAFLARVVEEFGPFDVIIDDGSHQCSHMIASFNSLFAHGLTPRGLYIVEDTHTNYWATHRDQRYSFVDFAKDLVETLHAHYRQAECEPNFRPGAPERIASFQVPRLTRELSEIRFFDSMVVCVRRQDRPVPVSEHR